MGKSELGRDVCLLDSGNLTAVPSATDSLRLLVADVGVFWDGQECGRRLFDDRSDSGQDPGLWHGDAHGIGVQSNDGRTCDAIRQPWRIFPTCETSLYGRQGVEAETRLVSRTLARASTTMALGKAWCSPLPVRMTPRSSVICTLSPFHEKVASCSADFAEGPFGLVVADGGVGLGVGTWHHRAHERAHRLR